jgi:uncharacterized membrane protein
LIEFDEDRQVTLRHALNKVREKKLLVTGDTIVVVTDFAGTEHVTSAIQVRVI